MLSRLTVASLAFAVTSGRGAGMLRPQSWDARAAGHKASSGAVGVRAKVFGSTTVFARTCVVRSGEAWCWGNNESRKMGMSGTGSWALPVPVPGIDDAARSAAGRLHTCAVRAD